ncbi:hypothetical protein Golomagni_00098 [Golovinomyces magnicellulatus]|nr:hypothetical protein Golomagni_00098 [Golovinomyces magnicellulatus]
MLKSKYIVAFERGTPAFKSLIAFGYVNISNLRTFSIFTSFNADEEKSRRSRSAEAFNELKASAPRPVREAISPQSIKKTPSSNPDTFVQITRSPVGPPLTPRNITAARTDKRKKENSPKLVSSGNNIKSSSVSGRLARGIAAKWSSRVRNEKASGGKGRKTLNRSLRGAPKKPRKKPWEEEAELPYNEEETEYADLRDGGFTTPYNPDTSAQNLARHRPPVISNGPGIVDSLRYRLAVTTDNISPQYRVATQHFMRIERGKGTLFEDLEQRAIIQEWKDNLDRELAEVFGFPYERRELGTLPKKIQEDIMKQWVAGNYEGPRSLIKKNPFTYVRNYASRNETWLPEDTKKFEAKFASLLPPNLRAMSQEQ